MTYTYNGSGRKLRSSNGTGGQVRDYIEGIEYSGGSLEPIHLEEGRIVRSGSNYRYEYVLRDYPSNVRSGFEGGTGTASNFGTD